MIVKYVNSMNESVVLNGDGIKLREADFYDHKWDKEDIDKKIIFAKEEKEYKAVIEITGTRQVKRNKLNNFLEIVEKDIYLGKKGKLFYGDFYLECNITEEKSEPAESPIGVIKEIGIFCEKAVWIKEQNNSFPPFENSSGNNKRYPGMYPHRYANGLSGAYLINEHFTDSNFLLRIYGPVANPQVFIGEYPYLIYTILEQGEYLEINSRDQTVIKYLLSGHQANIYHSRAKRKSVFRKIPPGRQIVSWTGKFPLDIVLYEERSEPKW